MLLWQRDLCVAHGCVGGVLRAQARLDDALREFLRYKKVMQRLARRDGENGDWQRELSVAHHCVGSVLQAQGRLEEALLEYQATKQIMLRLTQRYPDNADWQRDLAFAYFCVGSASGGPGRTRSSGPGIRALTDDCQKAGRCSTRQISSGSRTSLISSASSSRCGAERFRFLAHHLDRGLGQKQPHRISLVPPLR